MCQGEQLIWIQYNAINEILTMEFTRKAIDSVSYVF